MKKSVKVTILIMAVVLTAGFVYWQFIKKGVIRNAVENAVSKETDSLYYIKYESSTIDEINGNATFNKIVLQSDSLQEKLLSDDSSVSATIFNVRIEQLKITGANIPSFLQQNTIEANRIEILRPVITIIKTGKIDSLKLSAKDSSALYDRITGKFKSINAKEIKITDATITFTNGKESPHTNLKGIDVSLKNFRIDSTRNYDNIISYFVKDIIATVKSVNVKDEKTNKVFIFEKVEFNAPGRFINIGQILQKNNSNNKVMQSQAGISVRGISTTDFILNNKLKADSVISNGGAISIFRSKKSSAAAEDIEIDNDFFDKALIKNIRIGSTTLSLYNKAKPNEAPFIFKNLRFTASGLDNIYDGTNLKKLIGNSSWKLSADGITLTTKDNMYKLVSGPFILDQEAGTISVKYFAVVPQLSEQAFVKQLKVQKDRLDIRINNIFISGADVRALIKDNKLVADNMSFQPIIKIFNDRTVPFDMSDKTGKYPHQQLMKVDFPIFIKMVTIKNGLVSYRERGALSKQVGDVFFNNLSASISNVTNMKEKVSANNMMVLTADTKFLGVANIHTTWKMPLNSANGTFSAAGTTGSFDAKKLNAITEPLGVASIKKGIIKSLVFNIEGTDLKATGKQTLLYNDLKISLLKPTTDSTAGLEKRGLVSFFANVFTKDQNPSGNSTRVAKIEFNRDMAKSFFNLLWKSIFAAAKRTASGKNDF